MPQDLIPTACHGKTKALQLVVIHSQHKSTQWAVTGAHVYQC